MPSNNSVYTRGTPMWPLGYVNNANNNNATCIMYNIDPNNNNSPETVVGTGANSGLEYTPAVHRVFMQGFKPNANNNGMTPNNGNVYLMLAPTTGTGNRSDMGAMLFVVAPGSSATWPSSEMEWAGVSPYKLYIASDANNEGALVSCQV